jgi:peptide/nickel transport system substrate-binding protein
MIAPTQLINIQRGKHEVAIDLSADQATSIKGNKSLKVSLQPSTWIFWMIPNMFLGSLPQKNRINQNITKAKAELALSGVGNQKITLEFPSDLTINGVPFSSLAQKVQANLQAIGFNVDLAGSTVGTWLQKYRDGKMAFGLSLWGPDYPDPADYLAFTPGQLVGVRAGWPAGSDPALEKLAAKALVTTASAARSKIYQQIQIALNQRGPFIPLLQPTQVFVSTTDLKNAVFNPEYQIDVTQASAK